MTIIEARELAMQGKTLVDPTGTEWPAEEFLAHKNWPDYRAFGVWREKKEPRRNYRIERDGELCDTVYELRELAEKQYDTRKGERIVEFVEVVK